MKYLIKKLLIYLLKPLNKKLGFVKKETVSINNETSIDFLVKNLIKIIKDNDYYPHLILDVGSNHGNWTRIWKNAFPDAKLIMIEPQEWLKPSFHDLLDEKVKYYPIGAGKENGSFMFTINSDSDDSSTFRLNKQEAELRGFKQIEIPVLTIDEIVSQNDGLIPNIIKIDSEGLDIDVLEGATKTFGTTEMYFIEAAVNCNVLANDIHSVINYMKAKGYRLFEITDINRPFPSKALWLTELAFVKIGGYFDSINWRK